MYSRIQIKLHVSYIGTCTCMLYHIKWDYNDESGICPSVPHSFCPVIFSQDNDVFITPYRYNIVKKKIIIIQISTNYCLIFDKNENIGRQDSVETFLKHLYKKIGGAHFLVECVLGNSLLLFIYIVYFQKYIFTAG